MVLTAASVCPLQKDLWTESGLRNNYRRVDATEAKKHWEFWYKWTETNCTHGYTCSKCAVSLVPFARGHNQRAACMATACPCVGTHVNPADRGRPCAAIKAHVAHTCPVQRMAQLVTQCFCLDLP